MSTSTLLRRGLYALPVVGRIAREVIEGTPDTKWYLAVIVLTAWVLAYLAWGVPALYIPFVMMVPLCLGMLVLLTRG